MRTIKNTDKKIKALIGSLLEGDFTKTDMLVKDLLETVIPDKEDLISKVLVESFSKDSSDV